VSLLLRGITGKSAIVTGGGRGIGFAISDRLAAEGARVAIVDLNEGLLNESESRLSKTGAEVVGLKCDVSKENDVNSCVKQVAEKFGRVDILVNNAGITGITKALTEVSEREWDEVMSIDLKGVFLFSKAVLPYMLNQGSGSILSMASIAGKEGNANLVPYSTAKGGVITFTKALAEEVVSKGIRVNCVAPALIDTDLIKAWPAEQRQRLSNKIPMGRLGKPEEVASMVVFLLSDEASFITGQCVNIDGGRGKY
jgi:3-oxoacyl-[acyl-carrier protein] reductase